jgi:polyisoprenyl-phosphate glycosyltransferase
MELTVNPRKRISIVAGCFNEGENVADLHRRVSAAMSEFPHLDFEIILIDNASTDNTVAEIKRIAATDKKMKAIVNVRNFGHIRSPYHAFMLAQGDAVIAMASDLEDPPELIPEFIRHWERGYKIAIGVRRSSKESAFMRLMRRTYYSFITRLSDVEQIRNFTGFGLYDKAVMDELRSMRDPYPYFRGLIAELGFKRAEVPFDKPVRTRGLSKGTFLIYLDSALLGVVNHSRIPLRFATILGCLMSATSFLIGAYYLIRKLLAWDEFQMGIAALAVGVFFFLGIMFVLLGLIGEYVGLIVTHVVRRPMVVEEERINFD